MKITFTVFGAAAPAGSKKSYVPLDKHTKQPYRRPNGGVVVSTVDANLKSKGWQKSVAAEAREVYRGPLLDCPLSVVFKFYQLRPKGHYGSGANAGRLKGNTPPYPLGPPDLLKTARGIEDAMQGVIYRNDSLIVDEHLFKLYCGPGEPARVEIVIETIDAEVAQPALIQIADDRPPWERRANQ